MDRNISDNKPDSIIPQRWGDRNIKNRETKAHKTSRRAGGDKKKKSRAWS